MHSSSLHHQKEMVVGGRTAEGSVYFVMEDLARERVLAAASFLAVCDPDLDTGYIYVRDQVVSVEAFFFAWNTFYPDSESP